MDFDRYSLGNTILSFPPVFVSMPTFEPYDLKSFSIPPLKIHWGKRSDGIEHTELQPVSYLLGTFQHPPLYRVGQEI